ncbi:hypothetical protein EN860_035200, partial [Mesorhizobium sp. M00.F.Ca.ET.217.01.1.1]
ALRITELSGKPVLCVETHMVSFPDALPQTGEIASTDVLQVEALAARTGISGDEAQALIDRLGTDRVAIEQAARGLKAKRGR